MAQEGADALPARIVIVTGKSRSKEDEAGTAAKEAIVSILGACNSPFQVQTSHEACPVWKTFWGAGVLHPLKIGDAHPSGCGDTGIRQ